MVLATPLPFGSVGSEASFLIQTVAILLGLASTLVIFLEPASLSRAGRVALGSMLALFALGVLQLLPVGPRWAEFFSPTYAELRHSISTVVPIDGPRTAHYWSAGGVDALCRLAAYLLVGLSAAVAFRNGSELRRLAIAISVSATFQGVYGAFELISGRQQILGYQKQFYLSEATGTFINRNHFASYLAISLPLILALIHVTSRSRLFPGWKHRLLTLFKRSSVIRIWAAIAAFGSWVGILLSYSRAGLAVAIVGLLYCGYRLFKRKIALAIIIFTLLLPTAILMVKEIRTPGARFGALRVDVQSEAGRWPVWKATTQMALDHPLLGVGFGAFDAAFPLYRPPAIQARWQHAHNEWLQLAAEGGVASLFCVLVVAGIALKRRRDPDSSTAHLIQIGVVTAILVATLHSFVDFPMKVPAIAILVSILVGVRCSGAMER